MPIATGVAKVVSLKKESSWGTLPGASGAKVVRRISSDLRLEKATYASQEQRQDYQKADFRHGGRSVVGTLTGELSPGSYQDPLAAMLRRLFTAGGTTTAQTTISAQVAAPQFQRSGGSWLTDGHKIGDVVRFSGFTTGGVGNNSRNFLITALTASAMTGIFLDGGPATIKAAGDAVTVTAPGRKTYVPLTGHTDESFSIEHWHSDIAQSEVFTGCKPQQIDIGLPPTGMSEFRCSWLGKDMVTNTVQYFTSPTPANTFGVLAAVNGVVAMGGQQVALLTGLNISIKGNMSGDYVVGSNVYPDVLEGPVDVDGQMSVLFTDGYFRDLFVQETEVAVCSAFTTGNTGAADFVGICMPRIKVGGSGKSDIPKGLVQTVPFTALLGSTSTGIDQTTIMVQDSQAV